MIRKTESHFRKSIRKNEVFDKYGYQYIKRTTYWLFWIFPIYSSDEVVSGDYEVE